MNLYGAQSQRTESVAPKCNRPKRCLIQWLRRKTGREMRRRRREKINGDATD